MILSPLLMEIELIPDTITGATFNFYRVQAFTSRLLKEKAKEGKIEVAIYFDDICLERKSVEEVSDNPSLNISFENDAAIFKTTFNVERQKPNNIKLFILGEEVGHKRLDPKTMGIELNIIWRMQESINPSRKQERRG